MSSDPYLLSIDQGTTSSRVIVFDARGKVVSVQQKELTLHFPNKGWVEQGANDIWRDTLSCLNAVEADLGGDLERIAAAGIANQRETTILWDRQTGEPVYNAIVWQDRRTADFCATLKSKGHEDMVREKTGLLLDPYFSATKIAWILEHVDGVRERAEAGDILFGTVDCFLLWKLTGGKVHASDITNASRTMLYNVKSQEWDQELLDLFDIPQQILPEVKDNVADFGVIEPQHFKGNITIGGMAGAQQAALIGQGCFDAGMVKSTYGTGCFALMNVGEDFKQSDHRLLTTIAYRIDGQTAYALEGSIFTAGAAIQWLRDGLAFFDDALESEALATSVNDNNEVYFVPAFTGLGAPYWEPNAKAMISGLSRETSKAHIVRAALEAQAYQTRDLMDAMCVDGGVKIEAIRADGGLVANQFMCQFLSDMLDVDLDVPAVLECTAWGVACLAGLQAGVFADVKDVQAIWSADKNYTPSMNEDAREKLYLGWKEAVSKLL